MESIAFVMSQALGLAAVTMASSGTGNIPTVLSTIYNGMGYSSASNLSMVTIPDEFNCIIVIPLYAAIANSSTFYTGPCINGFGMFTSLSDTLSFSITVLHISSNGSYASTVYGYTKNNKYAPYTIYSYGNAVYIISSTIFVF